MRTNIFGGIDPLSVESLMGKAHPLYLYRENKKKLEEPIKLEGIEINKRLRSPIKKYKYSSGVGIGWGYKGDISSPNLRRVKQELPLYELRNDEDGYRAVWQSEEDFAHIVVIQQEKPSIFRLKKNLKATQKVVFEIQGNVVAVARASQPLDDIGTWGGDRRMEIVNYNEEVKVVRLAAFWSNVIEGMIPTRLIDKSESEEALLWIGSEKAKEKLGEEKIEEINNSLNQNISWRL